MEKYEGEEMFSDEQIEETVKYLSWGKDREGLTKAIIGKRRSIAKYYLMVKNDEPSKDLMGLYTHFRYHKYSKLSARGMAKELNISYAVLLDVVKFGFLKTRLSNVIYLLHGLGVEKLTLKIPNVITKKYKKDELMVGGIDLLEVKDIFSKNEHYGKEFRSRLRDWSITTDNIKMVSLNDNYSRTPLINLLMFLDALGAKELKIDVSKAYKYYEGLGRYGKKEK